MDVHAPKGSLVVLAGYTLERATCGLIKASRHRVVNRSCVLLSPKARDMLDEPTKQSHMYLHTTMPPIAALQRRIHVKHSNMHHYR